VFFHEAGEKIGLIWHQEMTILAVRAGKEAGVIEARLISKVTNSMGSPFSVVTIFSVTNQPSRVMLLPTYWARSRAVSGTTCLLKAMHDAIRPRLMPSRDLPEDHKRVSRNFLTVTAQADSTGNKARRSN
jgi:hypothetical protein